MTTSLNSSLVARDASYQFVHYLRKTIDVGSVATGTLVNIGSIPSGAMLVTGTGVIVTTDLTGGGTTNTVNVGYADSGSGSTDVDAYATALALTTTTGGFTAADELGTNTARPRSVDTVVTATWTGSATTGVFDVVVAFVPNR